LSEQYGYIVIFPTAQTTSEHCWDVATRASNTHNGGSDTLALVNMVKYAISTYKADPKKVFVTGTSSGGMMTNLLAATYPDVFAAGSAYSGIPASCLLGSPGAGPSSADPTCASGKAIKTAQQWGDIVRSDYPGYSGAYPKMAIWHGTADNVVFYPNLAETLKQWSNVHQVSFSSNQTNTPQSGYTKIVYGDGTKLVGYSASGVGHVVPAHETDDLKWFGIA
jgi:acetylxylan esterase